MNLLLWPSAHLFSFTLLCICLLPEIVILNFQAKEDHSGKIYSLPFQSGCRYVGKLVKTPTLSNLTEKETYTEVGAFLGIRYGSLCKNGCRFKYQNESKCTPGEIDRATDFPPMCTQSREEYPGAFINAAYSSEDCFFLNIYVPQQREYAKLLPVVIHIHGGSFTMGGSHKYPALALASTGVVVVTFNYRLGIFGFFPTNKAGVPTNVGLMDQVLVMEWVQHHIERFHGDPGAVTIMGESAGAACVGIHLVSPRIQNKGLFTKAIMISGSDLAPWSSNSAIENVTQGLTYQLSALLACNETTLESENLDRCLQRATPAKLLEAAEGLEKYYGREIWTPVPSDAEGIKLRRPFPHSSTAKPMGIPLLIGVMDSEASTHTAHLLWVWYKYSLISGADFTKELFQSAVSKLFKTYGIPEFDALVTKITEEYECSQGNFSCHLQLLEVFSDFFCIAPTYRAALDQIKVNPNTYFFSMTFRSPNELRPSIFRTYHGTEIPYVFGYPFLDENHWAALFTEKMQPSSSAKNKFRNPVDTEMARLLISLWSNFIKTGNPTPTNDTLGFQWMPLSHESRPYLNITHKSKIMYNYRANYMKLWTPHDAQRDVEFITQITICVTLSLVLYLAVCFGICRRAKKLPFNSASQAPETNQVNI